MELLVIGLSHRTAPLALRERLAVAATEAEGRLQRLAQLPGVAEATLVSTCNRVEIYAAAPESHRAFATLRDHLRGDLAGPGAEGGEPGALDGLLYERLGREALHHLFRVAASLDSLVVGEPQILGQIKDAFEAALQARTAGPVLGFAFPRAFRVAKRVRRETGIARQPVSVSSVAVDVARQVWSGFEGRRVLVVGAGKMADLAARALRGHGAAVAVTNRTEARAEELAARLGCTVEPFGELEAALGRADIVITSTGARQPLVGPALLERVQRARRRRPLVLIDIAVPRDVDPAVDDLEGIFRWDIDDLQEEVARNLHDRRHEADRAEALVEEELERALRALRGRGVGPTITALRTRYYGVARAEADKALSGLPGLDERGRRAVVALAEGIAAKLLHAPQVALRRGGASDDGDADALLAAAQSLFDLPPVTALPGGASGQDEALKGDEDEDEGEDERRGTGEGADEGGAGEQKASRS